MGKKDRERTKRDRALRECGCEHLFDILKPDARRVVFPAASETRRHLEMPVPSRLGAIVAKDPRSGRR